MKVRASRPRLSDTVVSRARTRKVSRLKLGVSLAIALVAAVWSIDKISLFPPALTTRALDMATATTHVVVDTPDSIMVDLRQNTYSLQDMTSRAVVLGNVVTSSWMEAKIAEQANVPLQLLRIQAPLTPTQPTTPADAQTQRQVSDILKSNDQYRIVINANPTVPMLDVYAQAPTSASAAALANATVDQLKAYQQQLASSEATPAKDRISLEQLGRATGAVVNPGVKYQVAMLIFVLIFLGSWASLTYLARVRTRWRALGPSEGAHA